MARSTGTRNPVKQWAITFPQSGEIATKESFWESWPPSSYSVCCEEEHANGGVHLHLGLVLKKGMTKSKLLEWVIDRWPAHWKRIDVQACKNMKDWTDYCNKEDPNSHVRGRIREAERCTKKYGPDEAMRDIILDLFREFEKQGERRKYLQSRENHLREKYKKEREEEEAHWEWLKENGYV